MLERVELAAVDPELASDSDSPAAERVRIARAKLLELEYEQRTDAVLNKDEMVSGMMQVAGCFMAASEQLQQEFGPEAYSILEQAHAAAKRKIREMFGDCGGPETT